MLNPLIVGYLISGISLSGILLSRIKRVISTAVSVAN